MTRFELLVDEIKTKLKRNLTQKELVWVRWVVDSENVQQQENK